jgi:hypothetical protein
MVYVWVANATEAKRCWIKLSVVSDQPTAGQPPIQSLSIECFHCAPTEANDLQRHGQWSVVWPEDKNPAPGSLRYEVSHLFT